MKRALIFLAACGVNQTPQPSPTPTLPQCVPNRDGMITADELPIALGATLAYYDTPTSTIDQTLHSGVWDFSNEPKDPTFVHLGPVALDTQWYAPMFPNGAFVTDAGSGIDGIYHQDDRALWLDGTASHDMNPAAGKTLVVYAQPVAVLRFPVASGDTYMTTAALAGATIDGLPFNGTDTYTVNVTSSGRLDVPYVDFSPVLEVQTGLVRAAGATMVGARTTSFLFECFGEVAHATSNPNETNPDFTSATELRRFALGE